mgnify:CR=1 FL=1
MRRSVNWISQDPILGNQYFDIPAAVIGIINERKKRIRFFEKKLRDGVRIPVQNRTQI